jgi:uncharacterized protein YdiU (UPF0061 family)
MEFPLENDPNIYLGREVDQTHIRFAYGNYNNQGWECGFTPIQHMVEYEIYQHFIDERHRDEQNYMATLQQILEPSDIEKVAKKASFSFLGLL